MSRSSAQSAFAHKTAKRFGAGELRQLLYTRAEKPGNFDHLCERPNRRDKPSPGGLGVSEQIGTFVSDECARNAETDIYAAKLSQAKAADAVVRGVHQSRNQSA